MSQPARILAFAGSAKRDSYNKKLVRCAAKEAQDLGARVTVIDLRDYPLPIFDEDLETEQGAPEKVARLKELFAENDGLLLACPEYNSSITPLLKNTIDWLSRRGENEAPLAPFRGKTVSLLAASPGALGGLRGLVHVRSILGNLGMIVLPAQIAVSKAHEAFNEAGDLIGDRWTSSVRNVASELVQVTSGLASSRS